MWNERRARGLASGNYLFNKVHFDLWCAFYKLFNYRRTLWQVAMEGLTINCTEHWTQRIWKIFISIHNSWQIQIHFFAIFSCSLGNSHIKNLCFGVRLNLCWSNSVISTNLWLKWVTSWSKNWWWCKNVVDMTGNIRKHRTTQSGGTWLNAVFSWQFSMAYN